MRARLQWISALVLAILAGHGRLPLAKAQDGARPTSQLQISLAGDARMLGAGLRLTPAERQTAGAAWFSPKVQVMAGFEVVFQFQLTDQGGLGRGADGFAFVLQNQGLDALAGRGSAGGFALGDGRQDPSHPGIPRSIAVFFDTFRNSDGKDPSDNYIAICTNGAIPQMRWPPSRLGVGRKLRVHLKDGRIHTARIRYRKPLMTVYLDDGEPEIQVPVDLSAVVDVSGSAYAGFTASTGSGYENHDILSWSFQDHPDVSSAVTLVESDIYYLPANCLEGRNLCTPAKAIVEEHGPGQYHVILPAHLEWGASIPNPRARPVAISKVQGSACLGLNAGGSYDCGGPDGIPPGEGVRKALLAPDSNHGALVAKTEKGRTWFSVNGRKGRDFTQNQGFFEFDVHLN